MTLSPEVSQTLVYLALAVGGWLVGLLVPGLKLPKLSAPQPARAADPPLQEVLMLLRKLLSQQEAAQGQKE